MPNIDNNLKVGHETAAAIEESSNTHEPGLLAPSAFRNAAFRQSELGDGRKSSGFAADLGAAPVASFTVTPNPVVVDNAAAFDASGSSDAENTDAELFFEWDFEGDGTYEDATNDPTVSHTYTTTGARSAKLRVTDEDGNSAVAAVTVTVNAS